MKAFGKRPVNKNSLQTLAICALLAMVSHASLAADNITLPAPEQLVDMSIQQRLDLMQSMNALPPRAREANLKALRGEIDMLSPNQKKEMQERVESEFSALPPDEQTKLRAALAQAHDQADGSAQAK